MAHEVDFCYWPLLESVQFFWGTTPPHSQVLRLGRPTSLGWEGLGPGRATWASCWSCQERVLSPGAASSGGTSASVGVWGILGRICPRMWPPKEQEYGTEACDHGLQALGPTASLYLDFAILLASRFSVWFLLS